MGKYSKFLTFKAHVEAKAKNADVVAATLFLQSKSFGHYEGFLQREIAKVEKRMRSEFNFVAKAAFDAEEDAFQKSYQENHADPSALLKRITSESGGIKMF